MTKQLIIRKVWKATKSNQLMITIPNNSGIIKGDYVEVIKIRNDNT